jgi:hypothetical protein
MDSDFERSMMLLRFLPGVGAAAALVLVPIVMFGPMVLYLIARWRDHRAPMADPQLGLKFAMHLFATTALNILLLGTAFLIYTLISPGSSSLKGDWYRIAFALLVPAGIVLGVHLAMIRRTNDFEVPGVRRLFLGYNLIVFGSIGFFSLLFAFQMLFMKGSTGGAGHLAGSLVLVYCTAWALLGWRFSQTVFGDWSGGAGRIPDDAGAPRQPPPQQPPAAAGGAGLPALGGGNYPPIEPR